ncbi:SecDF P1 head subdomain-containing protein [Actinomadura craniellae]|nr:hypothetical protein [Actinomadura craniellae]
MTGPLDPAQQEMLQRTRRIEAQRQAVERKRSRHAQAVARRRQRRMVAERRQTAGRRRAGLLTMVITLGVLIAAVAVSGGLIAASMLERPERLAAPLRVYPVEQVVPGSCVAGTPGLTGQTAAGVHCYRLSQGIAIYEVTGLRVQDGRNARPEVSISLLSADRRAFADLTRRTVGREVAFVVRDQLITAPRVETPVTSGTVVIAGQFTRTDAVNLIRELRGR